MRTLILNQDNIVSGTNNATFKYQFPGGNVSFVKGQRLAISSLTMYYSTFNITAAYNNNTFSYTWVDNTTITIVIPDGFYNIVSLNLYLQSQLVYNGHYLVNNSTGNYVYFLEFTANVVRYVFNIITFPMTATPTTGNLPPYYAIGTGAGTYSYGTKQTGSTAPAWVLPTNTICPIITIPSTYIQTTLGFNAGSYPPAPITGTPPNQVQTPSIIVTTAYASQNVPQITPLSSYVLTCSLLNNNYAVPNNLLYSFAPVGDFSTQFTIQPTGQLSFINIQPGQYAYFTLEILDQNLNPVVIQDPNIVILLIIADVGEY